MIIKIPMILLTYGLVVQTMQLEYASHVPTVRITKNVETLSLNNPERNITLQFDNVQTAFALPCDVDGNPNQKNISWRISYEVPVPDGKYDCLACIDFECINLTLTQQFHFQFGSESMLNLSIEEGQSAALKCSVETRSAMIEIDTQFFKRRSTLDEWKQEFGNSTKYLFAYEPFVTEKMMIIKNLTKEDQGWYTCLVSIYFQNGTSLNITQKDSYLTVLPADKSNPLNAWIIGMLQVAFAILTSVLLIMYKRLNTRNKYYERLIKVVTICNEPNCNGYQGFQMPIVTIHMKRSLTAVNTEYENAPVLEYEFPIDTKWEFNREKLTLGHQLGAGAFGKVVMANAEGLLEEGVSTPVAVKMLKDEHTDEEVKDLICEMEIMKNIGRHPNIINLLGCCSKNGPLLVIVEYAALGNLKYFLQTSNRKTFNPNQLVAFAGQIASGMQHLSSMKLIHRDLAARNILVGEGLIMKIADFGLARDVYNQEYYRKITSGKMPIRWMAPESLEERFFSTKSDVWSFGVLLWEIMTWGRDPYPFIADWQSFLEYLKQGKRLEQPERCPDRIYSIMELCWEFKAENRPSFEQISGMLESNEIHQHLNLTTSECLN